LRDFLIPALLTNGPYTISNGQQVDSYIDMYQIILRGNLLKLLVMTTEDDIALFPRFNFIAGRETAGALIAAKFAEERKIPSIVVRDNKRNHGTGHSLEVPDVFMDGLTPDSIFPNKTVLLVDDVSSAGVGMQDSIEKLRDGGFTVVGAYSIVYRGLGAHKIADHLHVPFKYLEYLPENVV